MGQFTLFDRREFLKLTGVATGGLALGTTLVTSAPVLGITNETNKFNFFVSIEPSGVVNIVCHRSEMGQGIRTGLPQVVADELEADWNKVNVLQGLGDERYGSQNTDGSRSIRRFYKQMREMGASARTMLEQAAAKTWDVPVEQVSADSGFIINSETGDKLDYGQLSALAITFPVPEPSSLKLKDKSKFKFIGKDVPIVDMEKIQMGTTQYGQDTQLDNMLVACIARAPVLGSNVKDFDDSAAKQVKGVQGIFKMPDGALPALFKSLPGVAVLADNTWAAIEGRKKLNITWDEHANEQHSSKAYIEELKSRVEGKGKAVLERGDAYSAHDNAAKKLDATYTIPYLAHAPMEPPAATAVYQDGAFEIWACTQTPQSTQRTVAQIMGVDKSKVKVNVTLLGGGFGRKSKPDFSVEAAILAKQFGRPVKVVWTREDELQHCYYHAISAQHYSAGIDDKNSVVSWIQRSAFPSISYTFTGTTDEPSDRELSLGFGDVPFEVQNLACEKHKATGHTRIGWVRSVANIQHAFGIGSFVDEVADKAGVDTYQMWKQLIGSDRKVDPKAEGFEYANYDEPAENFPIETRRLKDVLDTVVKKSGAQGAVAKNEGWGISVHRSFVSYIAVAVKVRVEDNKVTLLEMHSAIDAGTVVNPDRVKAQQESSMIFGASIALMGEISFDQGAVVQSNFHDYPVLRMNQCPKIETYIIESEEIPGGVGEPGTPPVAPAITNAIFHASGQRIRDLPINKVLSV